MNLKDEFFWCAAHRLQLGVRDSTKENVITEADEDGVLFDAEWPTLRTEYVDVVRKVEEVLGKGRGLTSSVRRSTTATSALKLATGEQYIAMLNGLLSDEDLSDAMMFGRPTGTLPESVQVAASHTAR
jgi:hypothetical protein